MNAPATARREELRALAGLALPLIAGYAGHQIMGLVDTAMVGRLGAAAIGGVGIGNGMYFTLTIFGLGCVLGIEPIVSQAIGAGESARARRALWQGIRIAAWVGLPLTGLLYLSPALLGPAGVAPATAAEVERYLWGRLPGVVPFLSFAAARCYLQARGVTRPILVSVIVANLVNVVANALLIYGDGALEWAGLPPAGLPALGVLGAGLASSLASLASFLVLALALRDVAAPADPRRRRRDPRLLRLAFRQGLPLGLQLLAEVAIFALAGVLAGRIGEEAAAGHQIAISLASFSFTVTIGIASATSVRVGLHVGAGDTPAARRAGILGLQIAVSFMSFSAAVFLLLAEPLSWAFTDDPRAVAAAIPLIRIAAVFQISDGTQAVAAGALRGAGDRAVPVWANLVGHWILGFPMLLGLGFGLELGAPGLWWGLLTGLTAVAVSLTTRFLVLSSRPIARL